MDEKRKQLLNAFQERYGYRFQDESLLERSFVHTSYANESSGRHEDSNERLEFLGDAVLELIFSDLLYREYPAEPEGFLTRRRSQLVCEASFAYIARHLEMGELLLLGRGEEATGGREKPSILSDTFEALCGAIYLDGGYHWLYQKMKESFPTLLRKEQKQNLDYKSRLQEVLHMQSKPFAYRLLKETGPDHDKRFTMALYVEGRKISEGVGTNKKKAEQAAARLALEQIEERAARGVSER